MEARVSGTSQTMLAKWTAEVDALSERKRKKWKGALYDKWNVRQQVRYVGAGHFVGDEPYCFEVWKQPDRPGGGKWWPVVDHTALEAHAELVAPLSEFGARMVNAPDTFEEFHNIQGETHTGKLPQPHDQGADSTQ